MASSQVTNDLWYRSVPARWKTSDGFRTDIRPSSLADIRLKRALFIVAPESKEHYGVFIPMGDLRDALGSKAPRKNGSVAFSVNLKLSEIDGHKVKIGKVAAD